MTRLNDPERITDLVKGMKDIVFSEALRQQVSMKGAADFVTAVDTAISSELKKKLSVLYPSIGFFSEEEAGGLSDECWILDPIDGTTNLVYGMKQCSISLGLYQNGQITFGVVYDPFSDECFTAEYGKGAYLNGKSISVSGRNISESIVEFGAGSTRKSLADQNFEIAKEIFLNCIDIRRICSSALDLCYIAAGRIDGYFETVLKPWDIAAGSLILEEAGGKITDYEGRRISFTDATPVIASNEKIHDFLAAVIRKHLN